jgi:hypothetical protein
VLAPFRLADEVLEAGGGATVWLGRLGSAAQERALAARMAEAISAEYRQLIGDATSARTDAGTARRRTLARLRREFRRVTQRDFFPPPEREQARRAISALGALAEVPP